MSRVQGPALPGRVRPDIVTVSDALGALDPVEALTILFHDLAMGGSSVPELVAAAAYEATVRLPRGMALTDARPGCWESSLFESMAPDSAVTDGPVAASTDLECPTCYASPDEPCMTTEDEADASVTKLSDDEVPAAVLADADLGYVPGDYDPPVSIADMRADLTSVRSYRPRAEPHPERRAAAREAVCFAGEWM